MEYKTDMNTELLFGTIPATWEAELLFFGFGIITTFLLCLLLIKLITERVIKPFWILPGTLLSLFAGVFLIIVPQLHNQNFLTCHIRSQTHYDQDVKETWCSYKSDINDEFEEPVFRGFVSER